MAVSPSLSIGAYHAYLDPFNCKFTPQKFNVAPEKWWLEDYFPIGKVPFQGLC